MPYGEEPVAIVLVPLKAPVFAGFPFAVINILAIAIRNSAPM